MYTIQLPRSMVVVFVALSSTLWFTTALLLSGVIYGENEAGKLSLQELMSGATGLHWSSAFTSVTVCWVLTSNYQLQQVGGQPLLFRITSKLKTLFCFITYCSNIYQKLFEVFSEFVMIIMIFLNQLHFFLGIWFRFNRSFISFYSNSQDCFSFVLYYVVISFADLKNEIYITKHKILIS